MVKKCCGTCDKWNPNVYEHIARDPELFYEEGICTGFTNVSFKIITHVHQRCDTRWKIADPWDLEMREKRGLIVIPKDDNLDCIRYALNWLKNRLRRRESSQVERKSQTGIEVFPDRFSYK